LKTIELKTSSFASPKPDYLSVPKLLFSLREGAYSLNISLRKVQNLIATKQLPVRRIGRRVLIRRKDLEAFARRDHVSAGSESRTAQVTQSRVVEER